jgi:hypothetical protein
MKSRLIDRQTFVLIDGILTYRLQLDPHAIAAWRAYSVRASRQTVVDHAHNLGATRTDFSRDVALCQRRALQSEGRYGEIGQTGAVLTSRLPEATGSSTV